MSEVFEVYAYVFRINQARYRISAEDVKTPVREGKEIYIRDLGTCYEDIGGAFVFKSGTWEELPPEHPGFEMDNASGVRDFLNQHLKEGFTL